MLSVTKRKVGPFPKVEKGKMNKRRSFPQVSVIFVHATNEFGLVYRLTDRRHLETTTEAFQLEIFSYTLKITESGC